MPTFRYSQYNSGGVRGDMLHDEKERLIISHELLGQRIKHSV